MCLQVSDLTFRRHILVQALILVDFLLSLTPKAKKKLDSTTNKSVLYSYTLSEENVCTLRFHNVEMYRTDYLEDHLGDPNKIRYSRISTARRRGQILLPYGRHRAIP